jgi:hypothetical protein
MRYVEGVPRSEQILWFIDNYVKEGYKTADRQHVLERRIEIDNVDTGIDIGVKCGQYMYDYLQQYEKVASYTEVFYPADNITLGELI